jgi:tRNA uridine 5-carboxymethylaminomethyl modification enzyme
MLTSRSEYRLILRQDNADLRLTEIGHATGLISQKRFSAFCKKRAALKKGRVISEETKEQLMIQKKYSGYIRRQLEQVERFRQMEDRAIPKDIHFLKIHGLSSESRHKLENLRPRSIGQAMRIAGISPADIAVLLVHLKTYRTKPLAVVE